MLAARQGVTLTPPIDVAWVSGNQFEIHSLQPASTSDAQSLHFQSNMFWLWPRGYLGYPVGKGSVQEILGQCRVCLSACPCLPYAPVVIGPSSHNGYLNRKATFASLGETLQQLSSVSWF